MYFVVIYYQGFPNFRPPKNLKNNITELCLKKYNIVDNIIIIEITETSRVLKKLSTIIKYFLEQRAVVAA